MTQAMSPKEFAELAERHDEDIRDAADELTATRRAKEYFIKTEAAKVLGIKPGDRVYVFPHMGHLGDTMSVEKAEYFGKSPSGELTFVLHGHKILQSGAVGKQRVGTSVFPLSKASDYKTRNA